GRRDARAAPRHRHHPRAAAGALLRGHGVMAGALALSSQQQIAFIIVGIGFLAFVAALAFAATGRRPLRGRGRPDIPPSMQPGPSDADLEKPPLEKPQGWGVAFVLVFVVFAPLVWLRQPYENLPPAP